MNRTLCLLLALSLCACASGGANPNLERAATPAGLDTRLNLLLGTPENEVPARLRQVLELAGPLELMDAECLPDKSREIEFYWEHRYEVPVAQQRPFPSWWGSIWGYYAFVGVGYTPTAYPSPPPVKPCTIRVTAKGGKIVSYRYQGEGCDRFPPGRSLPFLDAQPHGDAELFLSCP